MLKLAATTFVRAAAAATAYVIVPLCFERAWPKAQNLARKAASVSRPKLVWIRPGAKPAQKKTRFNPYTGEIIDE